MDLSQHLKTRMAQRKLAHAYLVVGEQLANLILTGAPPEACLPFLISLEKRDREEIGWMLEETVARLTAALPQRPDLLPVLDRLAPIQRACDFNISAGHLCGWLAAAL